MERILSRVVIVRTYQEALQVAEENKLTCITQDFRVVYPGAFITKAGLCDASKERITPYLQLRQNLEVVEKKEERYNELMIALKRLQGREIEFLRNKELLTVQISQKEDEITNARTESQGAEERVQELTLQEKNDETLLVECRKRTEELRLYEQRLKKEAARNHGTLSEAEQEELQNLHRAADDLKLKLRDQNAAKTELESKLAAQRDKFSFLTDMKQRELEQQLI